MNDTSIAPKVDELAGLDVFDPRYSEVANAPNCPSCGRKMLYRNWPPKGDWEYETDLFQCRPCQRKQDIADIKARNPPEEWDKAIRIYLRATKPRTAEEQTAFRQNMESDIAAVYARSTGSLFSLVFIVLVDSALVAMTISVIIMASHSYLMSMFGIEAVTWILTGLLLWVPMALMLGAIIGMKGD